MQKFNLHAFYRDTLDFKRMRPISLCGYYTVNKLATRDTFQGQIFGINNIQRVNMKHVNYK